MEFFDKYNQPPITTSSIQSDEEDSASENAEETGKGQGHDDDNEETGEMKKTSVKQESS